MDPYKISVILDDGKVLNKTLPGKSLVTPVEYPLDWFKKNKSKPPVDIPAFKGTLEDLAKQFNSFKSKPNKDYVLAYLSKFMELHLNIKAPDEWTSYGVSIVSRDSIVNPLNLLKVNHVDYNGSDYSSDTDINSEGFEMRIFCFLLGGYRYGIASEINEGDYKINVLKRMNAIFAESPMNLKQEIGPHEYAYINMWYKDANYCKLIAALDMYLHRYNTLDLSKLRVCTLVSRFRDCSAISDLNHLTEVMGLSHQDALSYCFIAKVRDEIIKLCRDNEEHGVIHSYFPYMRDLQLTNKSPYSASQSPVLHHWIHMVCALRGSPRSLKSRIFSEEGLLNIKNHAMFINYAFRNQLSASVVFGTADMKEKERVNLEAYNMTAGDEKEDSKTPIGIYEQILASNYELPDHIVDYYRDVLDKLPTMRQGTIGEYLKRTI